MFYDRRKTGMYFLNDAFSSQVHYFVSPRVVTVHIYTIKERQNIEDKTASNRAVLRQRRPELPHHLARPGHTLPPPRAGTQDGMIIGHYLSIFAFRFV